MNAHAANSELRGHLVERADIQRLLCVESHIKVNLAPSALAPRSTNLLSVWWGSWTSSPFQHRGTNPQDLSRFSLVSIIWPHNKGHRGHFEISFGLTISLGSNVQYVSVLFLLFCFLVVSIIPITLFQELFLNFRDWNFTLLNTLLTLLLLMLLLFFLKKLVISKFQRFHLLTPPQAFTCQRCGTVTRFLPDQSFWCSRKCHHSLTRMPINLWWIRNEFISIIAWVSDDFISLSCSLIIHSSGTPSCFQPLFHVPLPSPFSHEEV